MSGLDRIHPEIRFILSFVCFGGCCRGAISFRLSRGRARIRHQEAKKVPDLINGKIIGEPARHAGKQPIAPMSGFGSDRASRDR